MAFQRQVCALHNRPAKDTRALPQKFINTRTTMQRQK